MKEIYYCRHGITDDLENGIRNRPEASLTAEGFAQAQTAAELLIEKGISPDVIASSALCRALQTAQKISLLLGGIRIATSPILNERHAGSAIGMKNKDIKMLFPGGFDTVPGAEKTADLQLRSARAAEWLATFEEDTILVVGHGVSGRAMARHYDGRPYTE
ncbi:MAG TPA: histidine phosphatase family protein, partial [Candidatus Saccharimonadales bacterium]